MWDLLSMIAELSGLSRSCGRKARNNSFVFFVCSFGYSKEGTVRRDTI